MSIRRDFIGGMAAVFLTPLASGGMVTKAFAAAKHADAPLVKKASDLLKSNDVLILSPDYHDNFTLYAPMKDPNFWTSMKEQGATEYYEEFPQEAQPILDRFLSSTINKAQFIHEILTLAGAAMDKASPDLDDKTFREYLRPLYRVTDHAADRFMAANNAGMKVYLADPQTFQDYVENNQKFNNGLFEEYGKRFSEGDPKIARFVESTRKGKAVVTYGWQHILWPEKPSEPGVSGGIDDVLKGLGANVATIHLTKDHLQRQRELIAKKDMPYSTDNALYGYDIPDYVYSPKLKAGVSMTPERVLMRRDPVLSSTMPKTP